MTEWRENFSRRQLTGLWLSNSSRNGADHLAKTRSRNLPRKTDVREKQSRHDCEWKKRQKEEEINGSWETLRKKRITKHLK